MNTVPLEQVKIPADRVRQKVSDEHIANLAKSIDEIGLLHPPVLRTIEGGLELVSGFCRVQALRRLFSQNREVRFLDKPLPKNHIPYVAFETLGEAQALEVELQENTVRQDIPWQDQVRATARLHALYQMRDPSWSRKETAKEIGLGIGKVAERVVLAEHLSDPDVARAKTEGEGLRIAKKKMEAVFRQTLAQSVSVPEIDLRHGDARDLLRALPDESVHVFLTDPPYGIGADGFHKGGGHKYDDDWASVEELLSTTLPIMEKKAAQKAHLFLFCSPLRFAALYAMCISAGWSPWSVPFIWIKDGGLYADANLYPGHRYECVLMASKGRRPLTRTTGDVVEIPMERDRRHAAQKPIDLYRFFLSLSCIPGDTVCDPFCGSGTIFLAAQPFRVKTIGFELDKANIEIAFARWVEGK